MLKRNKKYQVGNKVVVGFILSAFLVVSVSVITFYSIRNLLNTVENLSEPNEKLRQLNGLFADVYLLDMSKTERTSDKDSVLEETLNSIKRRLDWLKSHAEDSTEFGNYEKISLNISELMVVYAGLEEVRYNLTSRTFSEEALRNIERRIKRQQERSEMQFLGRIRNRDILADISLPQKNSEETESEMKPIEIDGFQEELLDMVKNLEELQSISVQGKSNTESTENALEAIKAYMTEMFKDEQRLQRNFVSLEERLINKNKEVFSQIQGLISILQGDLLATYRNKTQSAYSLTYTVSTILAVMVFFGVVGSVGFIYSILNEVKKANSYRERLEEAKMASDKLAKAKQDFLANMSHEIRNPLHAIQGYQEALDKTKLNAQQREFVNMIGFASGTLIGIVNDILDFSKLEAGKIQIEKEPFDPMQLFLSIKNFYALKASEKGLVFRWEFDLPEGKFLIGDQLRINQILNNLLSNAIKFTQKGGVEVVIAYDELGQLKIRVKDSGMGMSEEVKSRVFKEFDQGDTSVTRKYGGTGLGLSIIKKLVELQEGSIVFDSAEGKGTVFEVKIPVGLSEAVSAGSIQQIAVLPSLKGLNVLLVDDDPVGLKLLKMLLEANGAKITSYCGGIDFRENFKEEDFDLGILDIQMPEVSGYDVLHMIKGRVKYAELPVIAMTANVFAGEEESLKSRGFQALILKPFGEEAVLSKIGTLLKAQPELVNQSVMGHRVVGNYDISDLEKFCMGDEEMLTEVLTDIISVTSQNLVDLEAAITKNDLNKIMEITHQLGSRLSQIKADEGVLARSIETAIKENRTDMIREDVDKLLAMSHKLIETLREDFNVGVS
ncbi:hybrid sensor histidine kinase/response regulator [Cecembia calidifontis]|uniref:histidine kinase n=1 Tax=Cecembia calidifontis TaxID=1187080 RepID=A0A4Q7P9M5_9BACT|nr:ATP-binding protein [Cecembia calidifontis]RZS96278.1 signal transduction histidine kinase [Cecembia calidifontis]